jgi:hypothetical protein
MSGGWRTLMMTALLALSLGGEAAAAADDGPMRAAMVYNFVRFATWRDGPRTGEPLTLCVDPAAPSLAAFLDLNGKPVGPRRLRVVATAAPLGAGCHAAYLGVHATTAGLAQRLTREGVLTVGEGPDFSRSGVIGLVVVGRELRFEINHGLARRSGIDLSSKLLRLALVVR